MKKAIYILLLFICSKSYTQDFKSEWKEVIQYELDGKIKSANAVVAKIYKKAKRKNIDDQVIKCFFYQSKFLQVTDVNYQAIVINNLRTEIKNTKGSKKAILKYIYISILENYYASNSYEINNRTIVKNNDSKDFKTWSEADFQNELAKNYDNLLEDELELHQTNLADYKSIFVISPYTDAKNISLYDYLQDKVLSHYFKKFNAFHYGYNDTVFNDFIKKSSAFITVKTDTLKDESAKKIIRIYQNNEKYCLANKNNDFQILQYKRMKKFSDYFKNKALYYSELSKLAQQTTDDYLLQDINVELAAYYFSLTFKNSEKNYYREVLTMVDSILAKRENPNAKATAETLKEKILQKKISLNIPSELYANQNYRAFVEFKNVDTLKVSYYKLPLEIFKNLQSANNYHRNANFKNIDKDSLAIDLVEKSQPFLSTIKILPYKTDHFEYTTEILMDNLDLGRYLVFFETKNPHYTIEKAYAYKTIQVSNIDYVKERVEDFDTFTLLHKKTGQPLVNVIAKNNVSTTKSDKIGKINFDVVPVKSGQTLNSELLFTIENDTLYDIYTKSSKYVEEISKHFDAKAMVFFDRAIYRPGQKVYFKGYMFQNKNNIKTVVPNLTVHVIIEDVNENEVKTFELQTNEFGSFTGEYDIPKNVLTGEFNLIIEEPEDYSIDKKYYNEEKDEHSFWDNVTYDDYKEFRFKVEEYKRPTFEITFDEIKENYTIGDSITLKGNAKTLAASNLTNAKVTYTLSKNITLKNDYYSNGLNKINLETTTDENGNFEIPFIAVESSIENSKIDRINYFIETSITDLNGETRTSSTSAIVGDKMLKIYAIVKPTLIQEEKLSLEVNATTLNNHPIATKGTITFYEKLENSYLITRQRFPELNSISKSDFQKLFPLEAFDQNDLRIEEKKLKTIKFETEKSTTVDLSFMKDFQLSNYKILIETKDQKGNDITSQNYFELTSVKKKANKKSLFSINQLQNDKDNFVFEILSVVPDLYISTRFFTGMSKHLETVTQIKNGYGIVKFPKKSNYDNDIQFHFSSLWENIYYSNQIAINKEEIKSKLDFEIVSMRNKIEPSSIESWSFLVKNSKLQSEVLASMYDTSLDQFATSNWKMQEFYKDQYFPDVIYKTAYYYNNTVRFTNLYFDTNYYKSYSPNPEIYWFGFNFNNKNKYVNDQYLKKVKAIGSLPKNAKTVYGVVSDNFGPIPGANVIVSETNRTTVTDFDGYFEIEAAEGEMIVFSFLGCVDATLTVGKNKKIDVVLTENSNSLNEVVINAGYRNTTTLKSSASQRISSETIENRPNVNLLATLQGQVAGANISFASGQPGSGASIIIRGSSSISGNNDPLYVIDGVPLTQAFFRNLNENDLESVTVLKAADATTIYGNRGVNGVIIINTKSGMKALEQVKTRTNFNETAFFYPNLTTDAKGNLNFSFTSPESLTKWKLRLFAHNKKAETGYFQTDIISQKDIMVMPNMPRFLREKDQILLTTKVVNMTNETKTGTAILLLYDAVTNTAIDSITMNRNNVKLFNCKPKQSVVVSWTIILPENVQGLRYKVIAKSGTTSDGEENILPVLTDKILITESIPIWVKGNTKREFVLQNLKNNTSKTLQNHALTFEYTSNPVWIALQSLPYLMTYEHDCAEQTFAKYYANCIAEKIISTNPKIESLFKKWLDDKTVKSKLKMNEELKSIVLSETPWLLDAESDAEKNKRLAVLMDLNNLKGNNIETFKKLEDKMLPTGGFPWFSGGTENRYISQHILSGIGHLKTLFPEDSLKYKNIVSKGIPNLDSKFVASYSKKEKIMRPTTTNLNYLYTRSFFLKNYPLSKKCDSIVQLQLKQCKEDWLSYSLYEKGLLSLLMHRFKEKDFAKKIITSLKETVSNNDEIGMYWIENTSGYGWYQSSIETQALLIEAFAEIDNDKEFIDAMKVWLIKNKQTSRWATTKATTEAVYALISQGSDWVSLKDNTKIKIGDEKILTKKLLNKEAELQSGYLKIQFDADEINTNMGVIVVDNKTTAPSFGGVYWQYFESLENIKKDSTKTTSIDKKLFKKVKTANGEELAAIDNETMKVGDLLTVRIIIKSENDLDFVHLKDLRASCLEPVDVISGYEWKGNCSYYKSTKDVATNFFFDQLTKGTYVLEYDLRVTNQGVFNNGISTFQSMYAPEFSSHSESSKVVVKE